MRYLSFLLVMAVIGCDEAPRSRVSGPQGRPADLPPPPYEDVGPEVVEKGKVLEVAFRLGSSTTTTSVTPGYNKTIAKSAWDDPFGMHSKTIEVPATNSTSTVNIQDQFAVVFECQHGKFIIESLGRESRAGLLWKKLKQGDPVNIQYKEVFRVVPALEERKLVKFEFIDANVAKE